MLLALAGSCIPHVAWTVCNCSHVVSVQAPPCSVRLLQAIQPQAQPPALLMVDVMAATGIEDLLGRGTAGVAPHELLCSLQWADSSSEEGAGEGCSAPCGY